MARIITSIDQSEVCGHYLGYAPIDDIMGTITSARISIYGVRDDFMCKVYIQGCDFNAQPKETMCVVEGILTAIAAHGIGLKFEATIDNQAGIGTDNCKQAVLHAEQAVLHVFDHVYGIFADRAILIAEREDDFLKDVLKLRATWDMITQVEEDIENSRLADNDRFYIPIDQKQSRPNNMRRLSTLRGKTKRFEDKWSPRFEDKYTMDRAVNLLLEDRGLNY